MGGWILDPLIALLYHVLEGCGLGDVSFVQSIVDVFCAPSAVGLGGEVSDPRLSSLCHGEESELTGRGCQAAATPRRTLLGERRLVYGVQV